ncbi:hypothetical protein BDV93DRAFT_221593 [Ceratobasidium sp. AG-I]|nr:hypothetical protein BDV93DRAFT_221593 [Ceratobasidium sp. AG-I]
MQERHPVRLCTITLVLSRLIAGSEIHPSGEHHQRDNREPRQTRNRDNRSTMGPVREGSSLAPKRHLGWDSTWITGLPDGSKRLTFVQGSWLFGCFQDLS